MKRKRKVAFEIEHREISIFAPSGIVSTASAAPFPTKSSDLVSHKPDICPICGAQDMMPLADSLQALGNDFFALQKRINKRSVHLHRSPIGEWWVCNQSLLHSRGDAQNTL